MITVEHDVPARMRDGSILRADVYRPADDGPAPVLLTRTPYGKADPRTSATLDPVCAARAGFVVVVQDVRGRFASDGPWAPLRCEREDGFDTVEWAARLRGADGRVCMYGGSYCGSTQWTAASERPPSLRAIAPLMTWCEPSDGLYARGGALELGLALPWQLETGAGHVARLGGSDSASADRLAALLDDSDRLADEGYWTLPAVAADAGARHGVPGLGGFEALEDPDVAERCRVAGRHERVTVPSLHIGGWYDLFLQGTLDNYVAMAALGRPARLLVGPWAHGGTRLPGTVGELGFGMRANGLGVPAHPHGDVDDEQLAFFRGALDGADAATAPAATAAPVRIFVMGIDAWRDEPAWPLARARAERWHLGGDGALGAGEPGAGTLAPAPPAPPAPPALGAAPSAFAYDPGDPVPTRGGQTMLIRSLPPGPFDQTAVEVRADVLVFTSDPLTEELEVTGRVRAVLRVASSAPSTDWVARLCDVHPDGRSFNVCDGIVRVAEDADVPREVEIDMWSTSIVFRAGHRLRVHVTSSSFPRWDRNLNTGDQRSARFAVARQRVFHEGARSFVELPVVPR